MNHRGGYKLQASIQQEETSGGGEWEGRSVGLRLEWNSLGIQVSQKSHPQSETVGGVTICCPSWTIRKFRTGVEGRESHAQG